LLSVTSFASAVFSLSDAECTAGDNVKLTLTLACTSKGNSFAVSDIQYDETALEFKGFTPNEALAEMTVLPPVFDSDKRVIVIGFSEVSAFDGVLCTLEFAVKETAKSGEYEISARTVAKSFSVFAVIEYSPHARAAIARPRPPEVPPMATPFFLPFLSFLPPKSFCSIYERIGGVIPERKMVIGSKGILGKNH
jgi:hypothetical protein